MTQKIENPSSAKRLNEPGAAMSMGICVTCNNSPVCVNLKVNTQPTWQCDQFDDYVTMDEASNWPRPAATLPVAPIATNGVLAGLCTTCENKSGCANQTPGISKLYCEEHC